MLNRRHFLTHIALTTASLISMQRGWATEPVTTGWRMPDESEPHTRTWMAFGASQTIWGKKLLPEVRRNLANIATTISRYEPVSMLVREADYDLAHDLIGKAVVKLIVAPLDDLWMRDTGAVFVTNSAGKKAGVNFNFNGWGEKQAFKQDAKVAPLITEIAGVPLLETDLILEGGGIEVDGHGTAIISESCVLNANRNAGVSKADCEAELKRLLGLQKIIWLPGIKGKDITDGHTDFYAHFARPGVVVAGYDPDPQSFDHAITSRHLEILKTATDVHGKRLEVAVMTAPSNIRPAYANDDFAAGYINFYVCNGAVIAPEFGDAKADKAAHDTLKQLFPQRDIVQINIDGIAAGGGGIHCTTQQEPR
ncbi:MAG: agmatine deiminase family protein [Thiothrix sp.]|uniref:agmatine deiminase family protein n=1 Tax=Thiothrix sp. TaxID=1032 RepID=UPI002629D0A3|nr:agmatine deiminase family protein [Thiothrix sp.]MDD5393825.1 agmatine deiminase family protein [Thiothrix sp.]